MLKHKILQKRPGIVTYGITPPKLHTAPDKMAEIARRQIDRIRETEVDGLIIYDIQDEGERTGTARPFPYLETVEPTAYSQQYLSELDVPTIIYRSVGKYSEEELEEWLTADGRQDRFSVFVGPSSSKQSVKLQLSDAYALRNKVNSSVIVGGVIIPERHMKKKDEHLRVVGKAESGCQFFVSQATYNVEASKDFLSDYYYHCARNGIPMVPILFNIAPCGSLKTLEFMKWLGISLPAWLENELLHCNDILEKSLALSAKIFEDLFDFGLEKGIPIGCSVESVSTRKVEIEASIRLVQDVKRMMDRKLGSID